MSFKQALHYWKQQRGGFTLLEILLVIAMMVIIVGILAAVMDIPSLLINTRDAERQQNAKEMEEAMYQHLIDQWEILNDTEIPEGEANAKDICRYGITDPSCVNLDGLITDYLPTLPADPSETNDNLSGYKVYKLSGRPRIIAAHLGSLPAAPGAGGGGTVITTLDSTGDVGSTHAVFCPTADNCKISYYDKTNSALKFADCNDEACSSPVLTTVDNSAIVGAYSSIACPTADNCKISYADSTNGDLMFADCNDEA